MIGLNVLPFPLFPFSQPRETAEDNSKQGGVVLS